MKQLEKEFKYYVDHQDELVKKYNGKYIVIVGDKVVGSYDDIAEAYFESQEQFDLGKFLIHHCGPGEENYTSRFHSRRAVFA